MGKLKFVLLAAEPRRVVKNECGGGLQHSVIVRNKQRRGGGQGSRGIRDGLDKREREVERSRRELALLKLLLHSLEN
jgi:hypothetical protein